MTDKDNKDSANLGASDAEALASSLREKLDIRDRKHGIPPKKYAKCFVGSEAVQVMSCRLPGTSNSPPEGEVAQAAGRVSVYRGTCFTMQWMAPAAGMMP